MKKMKNRYGGLLFLIVVITVGSCSSCCDLFPKFSRCPAKPEVFPTSLDFGLDQNSMMFNVKNNGGGTLEWQAVKDKPWIELSQVAGSVTGETQQVEVTVKRSLMGSGTNTGEIKINTSDGTFKITVTAKKIPPPPALRINFSSMYINDDKEPFTEGDWRIKILVNGEQAVWVSKKEAGTGESVNINKVFNTRSEWNRVEIHCKVHELDDSEWEYVGEDTKIYNRSGNNWPSSTFGAKTFKFHNDEGKVTLKFNISPH